MNPAKATGSAPLPTKIEVIDLSLSSDDEGEDSPGPPQLTPEGISSAYEQGGGDPKIYSETPESPSDTMETGGGVGMSEGPGIIMDSDEEICSGDLEDQLWLFSQPKAILKRPSAQGCGESATPDERGVKRVRVLGIDKVHRVGVAEQQFPELYNAYKRIQSENNGNPGASEPEPRKDSEAPENVLVNREDEGGSGEPPEAISSAFPGTSHSSADGKDSAGALNSAIESDLTSQGSSSCPGTTREPSRRKRTPRKKLHSEVYEILEDRFKANPEGFKNSDYLMLKQLTGMTKSQITSWYKQRKSEVGTANELISQINITRPGPSNGEGGPAPAQQTSSLIFDETDSQPIPLGNEYSRFTVADFLTSPEDRTNDLATIQADIEKVKDYDLADFVNLLEIKWTRKAERLFDIHTTDCGIIDENVRPELRLLNEMNSAISPFSREQEKEVKNWKERFINKLCERGSFSGSKKATGESRPSAIQQFVNEVVLPWTVPFVYGRVTSQQGRPLSLVVALHDFCTVTKKVHEEWKTPWLMQYDFAGRQM